MIEINVPDYNDSLLEVELDEETFFLHFSWNETGEFWTLGIENAYNNELVSSLKILPERPLLQFVRNEHLPLGELVAVRTDNEQAIGRNDFKNGKATLFYMSIDDEF
ncbi:phage baseplate plug protein [Haemophilus parahaemolyticus]|uniref:phage baseplate plug family protein n=1 Tax=Haemophilus parahaemolyticus TaxID=735 RepID=UPI0028EA6D46|nr:hypothetical protein [Haemophilus parahaemolyticus]